MLQRLIWADSVKGILILMVVIGHAIQFCMGEECNDNHIWNIIYSFHMPAFMALSGWMAYRPLSNKKYADFVKRRVMQLLVPYFVWSFLQYVLSGNFSIEGLAKMVFVPDCYFWFLWVLFWISVVFVGAQKVSQKIRIDEVIPLFFICMVLLGIMVGLNVRVFGFQFIAYYFLFYTLGYCIHRFEVLKIGNVFVLCAMTAMWFALAWYWKMHDLPSWMPIVPHVPASLLQYAYRGVTATIAIIVLINVSEKFLNMQTRLNGLVVHLGVYSLGIYVAHLMVMGYVIDGMKCILPNASLSLLIVLVSVLCTVLSWALVELLRKNKITSKLFLGKV